MPDRCAIEAANLLRTLKKDLSGEEATVMMERAQRSILRKTRAIARRNSGESAEDALLLATQDFLDERTRDALNQKRTALLNLNARVALLDGIRRNFKSDPSHGLEAKMVGINRDIEGARLSADSEQVNLGNHYGGGLIADIKKLGLWEDYIRGVHDLDAMRALERMGDVQDDLSGLSKDAVNIARVVRKWTLESVKDANNAGASIRLDPSYIMRNSHDMFSIRRSARVLDRKKASNNEDINFEAWREFHLPLLDIEETMLRFEVDEKDFPKVFRKAYDALWSGVHMTNAAPGEVGSIPFGTESLARRMSQQRMFIYKNADAQFKYNEKFGIGGLAQTVARSLEMSANQTGLMRVFGPNARNNFNIVFKEVELMAAEKGGPGRERVRKDAKRLNDMFSELDGSIRVPGNVIIARRGAIIRAIQTMSKLGFATLSSFPDVAVSARALQHNGFGFFDSYAQVLKSIKFAFDSSHQRFELASMLGTSMDSIRGDILARVSGTDADPGKRARWMMAFFFKMNMLSQWTDAIRSGVGDALSHRLALNRKVSFDKLDSSLVRTLRSYGIQEKEWLLIQNMDDSDVGGTVFATPEGIAGVDDALVDRLIGERLTDLQTRHADLIERDARANEKDIAFVEKRQTKFSEDIEKATEDLASLRKAFGKRQDSLGTEIQDRIGRLEAEFTRAEAVSDVESFVVSERNRSRVLELMQRIEEGRDLEGLGSSIEVLAARESDRFSQTRGNRGERLGERRARSERRISQAKSKERKVSKDLAKRLTKQEVDLIRGLETRAKTFSDFVKRADERMTKRKDRAVELNQQFHRRVRRLRDEAKERLKRKLRSYFQDQVDYGIVVPDAKTNAFLNRGTDPGSVEGLLFRFISQFKSFSVAILQRPVARELFAQGFEGPRRGILSDAGRALISGHGEFLGLANLIATTSIMGYVSMAAKDLAKGRTPRDPGSLDTWFAAMAQGGGAGIYGDFLFGEVKNRFGGSVLSTLAGPTGGSFSDLTDLWGRWREGDDTAASAFSFLVNSTPFSNIFYLRWVMDFLVLHQIREGLNPGSLKRMERRIERENGQTFLLPPSSVIPRGGGTIGEAAGAVGDLINAASLGGED